MTSYALSARVIRVFRSDIANNAGVNSVLFG